MNECLYLCYQKEGIMMKGRFIPIVTVLGLFIVSTVNAKELKTHKIAVPQFNGSNVAFSAKSTSRNTTVTISGPNGFQAQKFSETGIPSIDLYKGGKLVDGSYNYEITTAVGKMVLIEDTMNNGRGEDNNHYARKGVTQTGHFRVVNGAIKRYENIKEPTAQNNF
jgi:hypothetical protein